MSAAVFAFPSDRRRTMLRRLAWQMVSARDGSKRLAVRLEQHRAARARKGIPTEAVEADMRRFVAALSCEPARLGGRYHGGAA
jgi:hypothetical protein